MPTPNSHANVYPSTSTCVQPLPSTHTPARFTQHTIQWLMRSRYRASCARSPTYTQQRVCMPSPAQGFSVHFRTISRGSPHNSACGSFHTPYFNCGSFHTPYFNHTALTWVQATPFVLQLEQPSAHTVVHNSVHTVVAALIGTQRIVHSSVHNVADDDAFIHTARCTQLSPRCRG